MPSLPSPGSCAKVIGSFSVMPRVLRVLRVNPSQFPGSSSAEGECRGVIKAEAEGD